MNIYSPNQSITKSYKRESVNASNFNAFRDALKELLGLVPNVLLERSLNGYFKPFLDNSLYKGRLKEFQAVKRKKRAASTRNAALFIG